MPLISCQNRLRIGEARSPAGVVLAGRGGQSTRMKQLQPFTQVVLTNSSYPFSLDRHFSIAWRVSGGNWLYRIPSEGL